MMYYKYVACTKEQKHKHKHEHIYIILKYDKKWEQFISEVE